MKIYVTGLQNYMILICVLNKIIHKVATQTVQRTEKNQVFFGFLTIRELNVMKKHGINSYLKSRDILKMLYTF